MYFRTISFRPIHICWSKCKGLQLCLHLIVKQMIACHSMYIVIKTLKTSLHFDFVPLKPSVFINPEAYLGQPLRGSMVN